MTGVASALQAFWAQFLRAGVAIPAYEQGVVPDGASMPYITYEVVEGGYFGAAILPAFLWVERASGIDASAIRAEILDAVAEAIPTEGVQIIYDGGAMCLRRNDAGFLSNYDDPNDRSVLGGRISYEATFYDP